jgi:hypothetical protein
MGGFCFHLYRAKSYIWSGNLRESGFGKCKQPRLAAGVWRGGIHATALVSRLDTSIQRDTLIRDIQSR